MGNKKPEIPLEEDKCEIAVNMVMNRRDALKYCIVIRSYCRPYRETMEDIDANGLAGELFWLYKACEYLESGSDESVIEKLLPEDRGLVMSVAQSMKGD